MDKENGNRKKSTKGKVATERVQMGRSRGKREKKNGRATERIITAVKLGIKEKREEKGEEEGCMERKVHVGNKWWKIMTIYSKEMKTTKKTCRRRNERKQGRSYTLGKGVQRKNRRKRSKKVGRGEGGWEKKSQRQCGKCRGERLMECIEENG
jgi:hypothetical protein